MASCKKCNCNETFIARKKEHYGLYCKKCFSWIKWIPISEISFTKPIHEIDFYKKPISKNNFYKNYKSPTYF